MRFAWGRELLVDLRAEEEEVGHSPWIWSGRSSERGGLMFEENDSMSNNLKRGDGKYVSCL